MRILATLQHPSLFSSLPPPPSPSPSPHSSTSTPSPPIPIPKHAPLKPGQNPQNTPHNPSKPQQNPALKTPHNRTKYYKPIKLNAKENVIQSHGDRAVVLNENGVAYRFPDAPFEFQYSYSETPKVKPVGIREPAFLPFAPPSMPRPWTGKAPLKQSKKKVPLFDSFNPPEPGKKGVKFVEMPGPFRVGMGPVDGRSREEVLGAPLKRWEVEMLVKPMLKDNRQVNLGECL